MDSAQKGEAITQWLPNEIITEVIEATNSADLLSLCRVSRLFHELCLPIVYRSVQVVHRTQTLAFCTALFETPTRAEFVRSFSAFMPGYMASNVSLKAIKLMLRLEHLTTHDRNLLRGCTVPNLVSCRIGFKSGTSEPDMLASFLTRHPTLRHVRVDIASRFTPPTVPIALPNLQRFDGPASFIPLMLPVVAPCGLREARLFWHRGETSSNTDIDKILVALQALTSPDTPFVSSYEFHTDLFIPIVTAASKHMWHVKVLQVEANSLTFEPTEIHCITACLPRFTSLEYIAVNFRNSSLLEYEPHTDRPVVESWADACPTLEACYLNAVAWRKVNRAWEEWNMTEFGMQAGITDKIGRYVSPYTY
ncbi:hypothetical protein FB451DRAFT_1249135 [Mycena latifolia]|nr:hypothetical protein FB451DRAFT_1249135 [Mycena latifolia]